MSDAIVERFRQLDVCAVSDALDATGLAGGATGEVRRQWRSGRVCGRVVPMAVVEAPGVRAERHLGVAAIEACTPGDVIVIEARTDAAVACWGGLLARAAVRRGVGGVLIDGLCRDLDEIEELRLPVFSRGVVPFTARRRLAEASVGEPVRLAGIAVEAGDIVVADGSGCAVVAQADELRVLAAAEQIAGREQATAAGLDAGRSLADLLGRSYEEMLDARHP